LLTGVGGGRVNADVMFSEISGWKFFIHLRHCMTPLGNPPDFAPAEDIGAVNFH